MLLRSIETTGTSNSLFDTVDLTAGGTIAENPTSNTVAVIRANTLIAEIGEPLSSTTGLSGATINLDSSVSTLLAFTYNTGGNITIRNTAQPLTVGLVTTVDGSIAISNTQPMSVGFGPSSVVAGAAGKTARNVSLTTTGATSDITLTDAEVTNGTLTVNSSGKILQTPSPTITAPTTVLKADGTIGTSGLGNELDLTTSSLNITDAGANAGLVNVAIFGNNTLKLTGATTAGSGDLTIQSQGNLNVAGNVSSAGGAVALTSNSQSGIYGNNVTEGTFTFTTGVISAPSGTVTLTASNSLTLARLTSVTALNGVTVNVDSPSNQAVLIGLDGTINTQGNLSVTGTDGPVDLSVVGALTAGGTLTLTGDAANINVFEILGVIASTGTTTLTGGNSGSDTFIVTPSISSASPITITDPGSYTLLLALSSGTYVVNNADTQITFTGGPLYQPINLTNPPFSVIRT